MTREELDFIGSMNMCDEISNEAYKKIVCHCGEQEPCKDAISRQAVLDCFTATKLKKFDFILHAREEIKNLPPVNPQPKTGQWIDTNSKSFEFHRVYKCSECDTTEIEYPESIHRHFRYCPNCGCRMFEPQESEDKQ